MYVVVDIYIEFLTEFGDLPMLKEDTANLLGVGLASFNFQLTEYVKGTKEDIGTLFGH